MSIEIHWRFGINRRPTIDSDRLIAELHELAAISDCPEPPPAVTRVVFTETDRRARSFLHKRYEDAGLSVTEDAIGNTYARWEGTDPEASAVGTGSHTDAIPHSGMYDGTVGVLGGLEAIRALQQLGFKPRRSIDVIMFTSEEPTRFGVGCTGSRAMSGAILPQSLAELKDDQGVDYDSVRQEAGFSGDLASVKLSDSAYHAFVELHIEQGPELEAAQLPIGIVTAIAAPAQASVIVEGQGGHAGGVLMPARHDALAASVRMIQVIEELAVNSKSSDLVATVGTLEIHPGAVNSIPSRVQFSLDLRDIDGENRNLVLQAIQDEIQRISAERGVRATFEVLNADPPAIADKSIVNTIERVASSLGHTSQRMVSRAYHDSLFMARIAPMGMIFIPCRDGVSHRPDEYSSPEEIAIGVETLALSLAELAS